MTKQEQLETLNKAITDTIELCLSMKDEAEESNEFHLLRRMGDKLQECRVLVKDIIVNRVANNWKVK